MQLHTCIDFNFKSSFINTCSFDNQYKVWFCTRTNGVLILILRFQIYSRYIYVKEAKICITKAYALFRVMDKTLVLHIGSMEEIIKANNYINNAITSYEYSVNFIFASNVHYFC